MTAPPPVTTGLDCHFDTAAHPGAATRAGEGVLGRVSYGRRAAHPVLRDGVPAFGVPMATASTDPFTEVWTTDRPVRSGFWGDMVYAEDGEHLFCAALVDGRGVYRDAVHAAYDAAFSLMVRLGYTELFRMWNLVGSITAGNAEGMEVYQDFCVGRARAFDAWADRIGDMPAATAIGALRPGVHLYFMACRPGRVTHIENPRQTPAYEYPARYGPKSPSFARATRLGPLGGAPDTVYVSGTAGIIGDETVHRGDAARQCDVTFANIAALLSEDNLRRHGVDGGYDLTDLDHIKVYVRDAADLPVVRARCASVFRDGADIAFLNVDVCRSDLLVEIEGICR